MSGRLAGWEPSGSTRVAGVIGDPIRHSLSPRILNAAFREAGLDWIYVAFPVASGGASDALAAMRTMGLAGLSVTMPHKGDVAAAVDRCSPQAAALGAVNCVVRRDDLLEGHNTDGAGFLAALADETGFAPADRRCVVLGAGGAARAVVLALADAGASEVVVVNRTSSKAEVAAALAGPVGRVGRSDDIREADLVVNATSIGMATGSDGGTEGATPFDPALLCAGQVVADLVYLPLLTPLVIAARERGLVAVNGVRMLVHQAAIAFELWTNEPAPIDAMVQAVATAVSAG